MRTHGRYFSAVVLYQLSFEDPYARSRPIYQVHQVEALCIPARSLN